MKIISLSVLLALSTMQFQNNAAGLVPATLCKAKEVVKVYPTPNNRGSITISSMEQSTLNFYLFDLEGKLIYQTELKQDQKQTVEGLTKGTYLFNAFKNDTSIEGGKVILK